MKRRFFFKLLPSKSITFNGEKCTGGKLSKERLTVLVGTNMSGSGKLKLLVIGKSKNPRCFKGITNVPVTYKSGLKSVDDASPLQQMAAHRGCAIFAAEEESTFPC